MLTLHGECLVYWLRELVFRSAWLDLRLIEGQLEVAFDDETGRVRLLPRRPSLAAHRSASASLLARGGVHPLSGLHGPGSLQSLRLVFKRAFTAYFLDLHSPGIADPTEAFAACRELSVGSARAAGAGRVHAPARRRDHAPGRPGGAGPAAPPSGATRPPSRTTRTSRTGCGSASSTGWGSFDTSAYAIPVE